MESLLCAYLPCNKEISDFYVRNCNVMKMFSDKGIPTKETPAEVAQTSDVIITMLPSSSHVSCIIPYHVALSDI